MIAGYRYMIAGYLLGSIAESHNFDAAPGENFDAATVTTAPILLYTKLAFLKQATLSHFFRYKFVENRMGNFKKL
jgi:hypothetical protein